MCRLVAYIGDDIVLSNVLIKPVDSIIKQSLSALESSVPTNGDGFGVGWYVPDISLNPAVFLSTCPAWNDENLLHLAEKIKSNLFFAHVRAASTGGVNNYNCHPFIYENWMFMHNGQINNFLAIKRAIINVLDEDIFQWIKGQTDSEYLFALFLQLAKNNDLTELTDVADCLIATFEKINQLLIAANQSTMAYYNICLTDGKRIIASRYCTDKQTMPESMHYLVGPFYWSKQDSVSQTNFSQPNDCVLIASEQLTDLNAQWHEVPINHLLLVESNYTLKFRSIL